MEITESHFQSLCRLCINENPDPRSIFTIKISVQEVEAAVFLKKLTDLELSQNDNLPKAMCSNCLEKLTQTYYFIQQCVSSDSALRNQRILLDEEKLKSEFVYTEETSEKNEETKPLLGEKYKCSVCSVSFSNKSKFQKHEKIHKSDPFKCAECLQTFSKKLQLNVHLRSHVKNEDKKFVCSICGRQFIYEYLLKQHQFKHSDLKPFPCSKCSKGCLTAESLRRHMKVHDEHYAKKRHSCKVCAKEFAYPSFLAEHMKNHTGERPHLCQTCGKGFRQSGALHYHQRVHTGYKPFSCKICNGNFMSQSVLKVHMRKHTNERPYVCHICGMAFRQSTDLRTHQRTHSGDKPVLCPICGKRMSTTGQLTVHIRSHTGEKPFGCQRCQKAFTTRTMLVKHERIHTGERPYVCDICGRAFNQSSTLKSHRNTHQMNRKRRKIESKEQKQIFSQVPKEEFVYKANSDSIETELVAGQFIRQNIDGINVVKGQIDTVKTEFTVILPAPIPLLHNL